MKQTQAPTPFRILIADDDLDDIQLIKECLKEDAFTLQIDSVTDGQYLLDYLQEKLRDKKILHLPHLILLDLNMPRKNGFEALKTLKTDLVLNKIPVIIFTTSKSKTDIDKAYQLGANSFVSKPSTIDEWSKKLEILGRFWIECANVPS